jgi:hypothetical protein
VLRDVDAESCLGQCCRVLLATVLPSHAGDGGVEATWLRCDVDAESCSVQQSRHWPWRDVTAEVTCPWRYVDAESCW